MTPQEQLAHRLAAGFLEKASNFAAQFGQENLHDAMHKALSTLRTDYSGLCAESGGPGADEGVGNTRHAVLLACEIATATLSADSRTVN
jgi:hypothetical protein